MKISNPRKYEDMLVALLIHYSDGTQPEREYRFHLPEDGEKQRRWRFDIAYPDAKIAFEVDGGTWSGGRHVNPIGYEKDCEKFNMAVAQGWRVFRLTPKMITEEYIQTLVVAMNLVNED